ncbi:MAG: ABC transporter ATP-binding protein [Clostridiales bacterium]|nr:ABC transporter ATP-binding protein [Clostridiales bacterium]
MNHCIEIKNLNQFYGKKQALRDVNLSISQGMFGLLGRNGAGKTTLMKTLAALLPTKKGEITVCGVSIQNVAEIRQMIGYLPQDFSMYPSMNVGEVLEYLAILSGLTKDQRKERIEMLLKKVNLFDHRHKKVKALSGGMKRRLGIAQALLHDPKVLIVDEPTAGLDPEERVRFRNLLAELAENKIVLLSTHIVGDIEAACEKIAIIHEGSVLYHGTVEALLQRAEGRVFTMTIPKHELAQMKDRFSITSMHSQGNEVYIRFIADTLVSGANVCGPNIEDAYMLYLHASGAQDILSEHEAGGAW